MEFRVLQYFLAVAREQSFSGAAEFLHLSQPTLSRQLKELEEELGKQLFVRGNRGVTLTEEGMLLHKRAKEICELVRKTEGELSASDESASGDVCIGAGESDLNRVVARAAHEMKMDCPGVRIHIFSGNAAFVTEQLDKGLIDFGLLYGAVDHGKYESIPFPRADAYGVLMRKDSPLAQKSAVAAEDLYGQPLIVSRQEMLDGWPTLNRVIPEVSRLNVVATYTLLFNGSLLVEEGLGYALCFDRLINTTGGSPLCFRPLAPPVETSPSVIWKKYQVLTKAAARFLAHLRRLLQLPPEQ